MLAKLQLIVFCLIVNLFVLGTAQAYILPANATNDLDQIYNQFKSLKAGKNADYIPELAKVNPNDFAIAVITIDGKVLSAGDVNVPFSIQSISKIFVYGLALKDQGEAYMTKHVGLNATGHPFNSVAAIEESVTHLENPLVNAGAIQTTSYIKGESSEAKWQRVLTLMQQLSAGQSGKPYLGELVFQSEMLTNQHNRAIARLLSSYDMLSGDPDEVVTRYTKACSILVNVKQLAMMGATLANHGVNPATQQEIFSKSEVTDILSEMVTNGLYENSGTWWLKVGLPAKSGVSGAILAVVPGKMAIAVFSPPLDSAGNSVRAQAVIQALSKRWHLHLLEFYHV